MHSSTPSPKLSCNASRRNGLHALSTDRSIACTLPVANHSGCVFAQSRSACLIESRSFGYRSSCILACLKITVELCSTPLPYWGRCHPKNFVTCVCWYHRGINWYQSCYQHQMLGYQHWYPCWYQLGNRLHLHFLPSHQEMVVRVFCSDG